MSNAVTQQKFSNLRKRLDQLGYRQPLGIESLPLVERLFADLLHTTDSLKNERQSKAATSLLSSKIVNQGGDVSEILEPYKIDNGKLVRDNNELHKEIISLKDQTEKTVRDLRSQFRKAENDRKDLLLLNNQYILKVKSLENDSKLKSDKILSLQEKNMHAVVQTPGGRKKSIPFRRQRMEIDCLLPESKIKPFLINDKTLDLLELADRQIFSLTEKNKEMKDEKQGLEDKVELLRNQMEERDKEIDRLYGQLQGGRPYDTVALEARNRSNERHIAHLNLQLDFMQQKNEELQKNSSEKTLNSTDSTNLQSELDKNKIQYDLLDKEIEHLKAEKSSILIEMNNSIENSNLEILRLTESLEKIQNDKKVLASKVTKLTTTEKRLVLEIEKLKKQRYINKTEKNDNKHFESLIKNLEQERDYWKSEVETLNGLMNSVPFNLVENQVISNSELNELKKSLKLCEQERDEFQKKLDKLKKVDFEDESSSKKLPSNSKEISELKKERNELKSVLNKFKTHIMEIESKVKILSSEKEKLSDLYNSACNELEKCKRDTYSSLPCNPSEGILRKLKMENEEYVKELRNNALAHDSLLERLKISTENQLSEKARFEKRINELEVALNVAELKANELKNNSSELQLLENRLKEETEALSTHKSRAIQLRLLSESAERAAKDAERRLINSEESLKSERNRCFQYERENENLQKQLKNERDQYEKLRATVTSIDKDKDIIQSDADNKAEALANLQEQLHLKERSIDDMQLTLNEFESQILTLRDEVKYRDHEIRALKKQLDASISELNEVSRARDMAIKENKALHNDLATMTKEHQLSQNQLDIALEEREKIQDDIKNIITQFKKAEELIMVKDRQRSDLLEEYKVSLANAEHHETTCHQLDSQVSSLRLEIMTRDAEVRRLREKYETAEQQIQDLSRVKVSHEGQVSHLTKSLQHVDELSKQSENENRTLKSDLAAVRELYAKIEISKDQLQRQLAKCENDKELSIVHIKELERENEALKDKIRHEGISVSKLESLLNSNREKEYKSQITKEEREAEIQLLRDRLSANESKIESQSLEVSNLRSQNFELQGELEKMRRQLTNEKFERERAAQELRRHGLIAPGSNDKEQSPRSSVNLTPKSNDKNNQSNNVDIKHSV